MPKKPPSALDIQIDLASWRRIPRLKMRLEKAAAATLDHLPKRLQFPCAMTVLLTGDAAIRKLNRDFRGVGKPTNVLSFPQFDPAELPKNGSQKEAVPMGDIALAYQYIVGEAKNHNKILINHITHLLIHGILHLFGYDHGSDAEALRMEGLEKKVMAGLDLPYPYASEAPAIRKK